MPFSADVTTETTRILADGNRIHQENHGKIYRDSEGRGTTSIEGYTVIGAKLTRTTEAGAIGNEQPLIAVLETWRSDELREVLLSKNNDPQTGETVRKLTNPLLFQAPPGYTTHEVSPPQ